MTKAGIVEICRLIKVHKNGSFHIRQLLILLRVLATELQLIINDSYRFLDIVKTEAWCRSRLIIYFYIIKFSCGFSS